MKKNGTIANSSNFRPGMELTEKFQLLWNFPTYVHILIVFICRRGTNRYQASISGPYSYLRYQSVVNY